MNDFEKYILSCKDVTNLVIYGTGLAAQLVYEGLNKLGIKVNCFCEHKIEKEKCQYLGLPIKEESDIPKNSRCLICANPIYGIENRLKQHGLSDWKYVDPIIVRDYANNIDYFRTVKSVVNDNSDKIDRLRGMLADEQSKHILDVVLKHRIDPEINNIFGIYTEQYFGNDLIDTVDRFNFVDCGAYNGDTLKRFIRKLKSPENYFKDHVYHAFETDRDNIDEIVRYCKDNEIKNVIVHHAAVWNGIQREVFFEKDENAISVGGKTGVNEKAYSVRIKTESLDEALAGDYIGMIAMDIEGAEPEALRGGREIIKKQAPILAVSVYHKLEHLWEIPMQIKSYNSSYKIYFRHHRWNMADTVCYAIK